MHTQVPGSTHNETEPIDVEHDGERQAFAYHANEHVSQLRDEAVGRFELPDAPAEFVLATADGIDLAEQLSLTEAGISPGSVLLLTKKSVGVIYNGRREEFAFHPDELVAQLLQRALQRFHITNNVHLMSLFDVDNVELRDDETLHDAGVRTGSTLVLRQSVVKGG